MEHIRLRQNIRKIYWYRMLQGMMFPIPTIVLFWQQHGMNLTMVMVLQALFALAMVILEMPSGYPGGCDRTPKNSDPGGLLKFCRNCGV